MTGSKLLIYGGLTLASLGALLTWKPELFRWFGKLPGDIHIKGEGYTVYMPVTSMIITSVALTLLINLVIKK